MCNQIGGCCLVDLVSSVYLYLVIDRSLSLFTLITTSSVINPP